MVAGVWQGCLHMSDPLVQLNDFMKKRGKITTEVVALVSHYMRKRDWIASFR